MSRTPRTHRLSLVVGCVAVVLALYFGREVLVPIALAVFVAFVLAPFVRMLERAHLPRVVAVAVTIGIATVSVGAFGWLIEQQAIEVAGNLHDYRENIAKKLAAIRPSRHSPLAKAGTAIEELGKEIAKPAPDSTTPVSPQAPQNPLEVRVIQDPTPPVTYARDFLGPALARLATAAMVIVFAIFMLQRREDLRNRLIRLIGEREIHLTTPAIDDVAQRLSRYLLAQSIVNASVGVVVGVGLYFLGMQNAPLWGFTIAVLRFVPYIGTWIGAAFPIAISLAVSEGWREPLMVAGLVIAAEALGGSFAEPLIVGSGTGLSPLAVLASAVFWAWLWGPIGLILSTPIAVCLSVLGKHVPRLSFLNILLGDEPVLQPETRFYQRLLAGDQEEASRIVEEFAKEKEPAEVCDLLVIPALRLAEIDRHRGELDERQVQAVRDVLGAIIDDLGAESMSAAEAAQEATSENPPVYCVPVHDPADELSARMLALLLNERGIAAESLSLDGSIRTRVADIASMPPAMLCLCAVPPGALLHTKVFWQQIHRRAPRHKAVVGLWDDEADRSNVRDRLGPASDDAIATTMRSAIAMIAKRTGIECLQSKPEAWENSEVSAVCPTPHTAPVDFKARAG